ncbi:hypothetical protein ABIE51_003225 [Lysobacter sp. OAE881]|uniref:sulfotransferase family 2 domain-containing protein n=1 Tax=Lysobacter sp. OAE881 TaxID=2663813 RepID=UPI00178BAD56
MIISHQHRFVFAAIPKTGTHSVRQALREHMSEDDLEQVGLFVNKRFPFEELAAIKHGHITLKQIRPFLGDEAFASYFKFAFVRNPFDRFISYCAFMTRADGAFLKNPQQVMRYILQDPRARQHILFQPQHTFVTGEDGTVLADHVGRVEDMQGSYDLICERLKIPGATLGQVNSSRRGSYRDYYDDALIQDVASVYKRDLELFGYEF